jgi:hypothetical protein
MPGGRRRTELTMKKVMPLAVVAGVVFVGYWMFTDPAALAQLTRDGADKGWELATQVFNGLIDFLDELFA